MNLFKSTDITRIDDFYNVEATFNNNEKIEFTINDESKDWGLAGEDNWPAVEAAAARVGIDADSFWETVEPELNKLYRNEEK